MNEIVECVPNISEGRNQDIINQVVEKLKKTGVKVLDVSSDSDHNRTVITFVGDKKAWLLGLLQSLKVQ